MRRVYSCYSCESKTTRTWYHNHDLDDNVLCEMCDNRYFKNPRRKRATNLIRFLGKLVILSWDPRNGICSECGSRKGIDCELTNIHHYFYLPCMPWACIVELCVRCHKNRHYRHKGRFSQGLIAPGPTIRTCPKGMADIVK